MKTFFGFAIAPNNGETFISLLKKCRNGYLTPLKIVACLPEELKEGDDLPFEAFVKVIAYPFQSLEMTNHEKFIINQEFLRLYPKETRDVPSHQKLINIIKRVLPKPEDFPEEQKFIPIGLDFFDEPFTNLQEPSLELQKILARSPSSSEREQEMNDLLSSIEKNPEAYPVQKRQRLLNLLFLEKILIEKIWQLLEIHHLFDASQKENQSRENPQGNKATIRTSESVVQMVPKEGNIYDQIPIEKIADLIAKSKTFDAIREKASFIQKMKKKSKDSENSCSLFFKTIRTYSDQFPINKTKVDLSHFIQLEDKVRNNTVESLLKSLTHIEIAYSYRKEIAPFTLYIAEFLDVISLAHEDDEKNLTLPLRSLARNKGLYEICVLYEKEFLKKQEIYEKLYKITNDFARKKNLRTKDHRTNFKDLLCKDFQLKETTLPETLAPLHIYPFPSLEETRKKFLEEKNRKEEDLSPIPSISSLEEKRTVLEKKKVLKKNSPSKIKTFDEGSIQKPSSDIFEQHIEDTFSKRPDSSKGFDQEPFITLEKQLDLSEEVTDSSKSSPSIPSQEPLEETKTFSLDFREGTFSFDYAKRVQRWFEHIPPLSHDVFPEYANFPIEYQEKMHLFHGFSPAIDQLVQKYGHFFLQKNEKTGCEDQCYAIAGEIEKNSKKYRGVFGFASNKKRLYHRFFSQKTTIDLLEIVQKAFYQIDFPEMIPLSQDSFSEKLFFKESDLQEKIFQDCKSKIIHITNEQKKMTIRLIPTGDL